MKSISIFKPALGAILILGCAIMVMGCSGSEDSAPAVSPDDIVPSTDIPDPEPEPNNPPPNPDE